MARERPRASDVPPSGLTGVDGADRGIHMTDRRMNSGHDLAEPPGAVTGEVAAIVRRADELGFSPTRVAIALGVSQSALASIEPTAPGGTEPSSDRRRA